MNKLIAYFFVFLSMLGPIAGSDDWPQFRGRNAVGWSDAASVPETWNVSTQQNIHWVITIDGVGHSSPILAGNRIFVTTAASDRQDWRDDSVKHAWKLYAIDAENGKVLWEQTAHEGLPRAKRHSKASQSNSTPSTDGKHVAAVFGSEGLFVYTIDGKLLWKKDLGLLDPGLANDATSQWGHASSPIIHGNLVIVQCDKHSGSFLAAYDIATGKEVWKTNRQDELPSWSTPAIFSGKETTEIITNGQFFRGYDVRTGKELWRFADAAEVKQPTPIISEDAIFFSGGYPRGRPIIALRTGARGDISAKEREWVLWKTKDGSPYTPTPILYKGHLYSVQNNGVLTCYDSRTGEQKYETKLQGDFSASPVANDGKLFFASEGGEISIVKAGPVFHLMNQIDMGSPCFATPAISNQTLFIRTLNELYAIRK